MKPEQRVLEAVVKAQEILGKYIEPGRRDCESVVDELIVVFDDETLLIAINQMNLQTIDAQ